MKHHTCDKCGMPTDNDNNILIDERRYDFCDQCKKEVFKNLDRKGSHASICNFPSHQVKFLDEYRKLAL